MASNNVFQLECSLSSQSNPNQVRTYRGQVNLNDEHLQLQGLNNNQFIIAKLDSRDGSQLTFKYAQGSGQVVIDTTTRSIQIKDRTLGEYQGTFDITN
ncbi:hypothetical protein C9374_001636 [Naegleria lovaniensis]|uniref:Uncharacterized protein n=1 Tax=Naegleria lovaniensis TaxID=51637 RepID=A0AA88GX47_NAELO|nr:uncharacterized protein C9374_001636 [Naegleria lovaniensis]KAG2387304.1 hypothetical protein C9374_001636 [Naegleria lovaniensis]